MATATVKIEGIKNLQRSLASLPDALQKAAEKAVLRSGGKIIEKSAKSKVPTSTQFYLHSGLLRDSIGTNVKKVRGITSARIGPRKGFRVKIGTAVARKTKGKKTKGETYDKFQDPLRYSHFIELGTSRAPAKPFIRPALEATKGDVIGAMSDGLDKHLTRVAKRLAKGGRK